MAEQSKALDKFAASFGKYISEYQDEVCQAIDERYGCESPVESILLSALEVLTAMNHICLFAIGTQKQIDEYRVDFFIEAIEKHYGDSSRFHSSLVVECDGHDFHEKTKEQASRDKRRDRSLQAAGYTVFRFTGSDIWNDPFRCAKEVIDYLEQQVLDQMGAAGTTEQERADIRDLFDAAEVQA